MPGSEIDLNPVHHITVDAIGKPGQRVFYLQAWREADIHPVTVILEKTQLFTLATGLDQMLTEIAKQNPGLVTPAEDYVEEKMHISPPVDPLFRAGEMGLGYDADHDMIVIVVREILTEGMDPEQVSVVRFWCSRLQAHQLSDWGAEVVDRGRQTCLFCGQLMEPEGHFCPKKNGHKH